MLYRQKNLKVGGVKAELTERLIVNQEMTVEDLKELCRQRNLQVSGYKAELIERLKEDGYDFSIT